MLPKTSILVLLCLALAGCDLVDKKLNPPPTLQELSAQAKQMDVNRMEACSKMCGAGKVIQYTEQSCVCGDPDKDCSKGKGAAWLYRPWER